jgi:hypothetical protein
MNQRRNFLKGVGIASAFVAGVAAYKQVKDIAENSKDIRHLAPPDGATTLQINGSYGPPPKVDPPQQFGSGSFYLFDPTNRGVTNKVAMTVGKDDRLWIQVGDEWRRVALEG